MWVGAVVVAIPVLTPSVLSKVRESVFFEPDNAGSEVVTLDEASSDDAFRTNLTDRVARSTPRLDDSSTSSSKSEYGTDRGTDRLNSSSTTANANSRSRQQATAPAKSQPDAQPKLSWLGDDNERDLETEERLVPPKIPARETLQADEPVEQFDFLFGDATPLPAASNAADDEPQLPTAAAARTQKNANSKIVDSAKPDSTPSWLFPESTPSDAPSDSPLREADPGRLPTNAANPQTSDPNIAGLTNRNNIAAPVDPLPVDFGSDGYSAGGYYMALDTGYDWWSEPSLNPLWADRFTKPTGLDAVVFSAMQNAPTVRMINAQPQLAQTLVTEADARFDWSTFVDASWSDVDRAVVSLLDTGTAGGRFLQQQLLVEGGLKKQTRAGGYLRVGQAIQRTDNNSDFLSPPDQATTQLLLDYRQPLLKGAGRHFNSSQIMLAQFRMEASQEDSQLQLQQFLVDVVAQYWKLYEARALFVQKLKSAQRAETLLQHLTSLQRSEEQQRLLLRVQAAVTTRQTELTRAQNQTVTAQESLLTLTHGAGMVDLDSIELVPIEAPATFAVPQSMQSVTETALQNRAEVRVALAEIKASAVRQQLALNHLKPQLDAVISTFISGVSANKNVGNASDDAFANNPSYAVGLSFELPLGRRVANARVLREELESRRLNDQLQQILGNVRLDARLAYRDVQSHAAEFEQFRMAMQQAAKELQSIEAQSDTILRDPRRSSLFVDDLLQSQARLAFTEQQMLSSQTELSIALVRLKRATGELIQTGLPFDHDTTQVQQATFEEPLDGWQVPATAPVSATPTEATRYDLDDLDVSRTQLQNQPNGFTPLPPLDTSVAARRAPVNQDARRLPQRDVRGDSRYR